MLIISVEIMKTIDQRKMEKAIKKKQKKKTRKEQGEQKL